MAHRRAVITVSIVALCASSFTVSASASANSEANQIASLIEDAAPAAQLGEVSLAAGGVESINAVTSASVPSDPSSPVLLSSGPTDPALSSALEDLGLESQSRTPSLEISLPTEFDLDRGRVANDGTTVFSADSGAVAVQTIDDGSVRLLTVMDDASAPTEHTYSFGPDVAPILLEDGSIELVAMAGKGVGISFASLDTPWAVDADGNDVQTNYVIDGNSVRQVVVPTDETVYPVVADPRASVSSSGGYRVYLWMLGSEWETSRKIVTGVLVGTATVACLALKFPSTIAKAVGSACTLIGVPTGYASMKAAMASSVSRHTLYPRNCFRRVMYGPQLPDLMTGASGCS